MAEEAFLTLFPVFLTYLVIFVVAWHFHREWKIREEARQEIWERDRELLYQRWARRQEALFGRTLPQDADDFYTEGGEDGPEEDHREAVAEGRE